MISYSCQIIHPHNCKAIWKSYHSCILNPMGLLKGAIQIISSEYIWMLSSPITCIIPVNHPSGLWTYGSHYYVIMLYPKLNLMTTPPIGSIILLKSWESQQVYKPQITNETHFHHYFQVFRGCAQNQGACKLEWHQCKFRKIGKLLHWSTETIWEFLQKTPAQTPTPILKFHKYLGGYGVQ